MSSQISWQKLNPKNKKIDSKQIKDLVIFGIEAKGVPSIFVDKWKNAYGKNF